MLSLFFKSTLRLIQRNKVLAFVKIIGLVLGVATFLFTSLFSVHELKYDKQHPEWERIHRYVHRVNTPEGLQSFAFTSATTAPALKERYPEVVDFVRVFFTKASIRNPATDVSFNEPAFAFADKNFLDFFSFALKDNAPLKDVLKDPFGLILTPGSATKYFGDENPIGRTLRFNGELEFVVKGVFKENPGNTHFDFDFIAPFAALEAIKNNPVLSRQIPASLNLETKGFSAFYTYLKLSPGTSAKSLEEKFPAFIEEFRGAGKSQRLKPSLQSLSSIHLNSALLYEIDQNGSFQSVLVYFFVGSLILLIACINYINISVAEFLNRAKGIGLKKILGITRISLVWNHLAETIVLAGAGLIFGFLLTGLLWPQFNTLVDREINLLSWETVFIVLSIFVITVLVAGLYPAIHITRAQTLEVFRGFVHSNKGSFTFRNALVFFQLLISFCLVTVSLLIYTQIDFLLTKDLGFDANQVLVMQASDLSSQQRLALKNEFLKENRITSVSMCSTPPGESLFTYGLYLQGNSGDDERRVVVYQAYVDDNFLDAMGLTLDEGRFFHSDVAADSTHYVVINRSAASAIGDSIMDHNLEIPDIFNNTKMMKSVVGIVGDFHFASFHNAIEPLILEFNPGRCRYLLVRFSTPAAREVIQSLQKTWREIVPQSPFDHYFLDDGFAKHYAVEQRMKRIMASTAFLAIALAALGIFGTTLFSVQQRTREIGIRKMLGSGRSGLLLLLFKPTFVVLLISCTAGVPLALLIGKDWLSNYPYKASFSPMLMISAFILILSVVFGTTLYHLLKVTRVNPADVLKQGT